MIRKSIIALLLVALVAGVAIGAGQGEGGAAAASGETRVVSLMSPGDIALQDSYVTARLPELLAEYGFDVEFEILELGTNNGGEWRERLSLMVSAGDPLADIIQVYGGNGPLLIDAGYLVPISEQMIQEEMPQYYAEGSSVDPNFWALGKDTASGVQYLIPSFNAFGPTRHTFAYRGDWLETLGLDVPETLEEFEEWMVAVRNGDPNGNGERDEFGYTSGTNQTVPMFAEIFAAFGVMPYQYHIQDDGLVSVGAVQPEAKEALAVLADWYARDLLPRGILTTTTGDDDFYAGRVGTLGAARAYAPHLLPGGRVYEGLAGTEGATIVATHGPIGPRGDFGTWANGPRKYLTGFGAQLRDDEETVRLLMRMLETIATERELYEMATFGEQGVHWDFTDPAAETGFTWLGDYNDFNFRLNEVGVREVSESAFSPIWVEDIYARYMDPRALEFASQNPGIWDPMLGISSEVAREYQTDLWNLTQATYIEIIRGERPLDYFDEYVEIWMENGGAELIEAQTSLYNQLFN